VAGACDDVLLKCSISFELQGNGMKLCYIASQLCTPKVKGACEQALHCNAADIAAYCLWPVAHSYFITTGTLRVCDSAGDEPALEGSAAGA
jgi:hypothetical protein